MDYDIEQLLDKYGNMVYRLAVIQMKNKADAEDIVQNTFLQLVRKKPEFETQEHAKAWLLKVAINFCYSTQRSSWWKKTEPFSEEIPIYDTINEDSIINVTRTLPQKLRVVIHLYYYEDLSIASIASLLKVNYSTVAQRLCRARKLLKKKLEGVEDYDQFQETILR